MSVAFMEAATVLSPRLSREGCPAFVAGKRLRRKRIFCFSEAVRRPQHSDMNAVNLVRRYAVFLLLRCATKWRRRGM